MQQPLGAPTPKRTLGTPGGSSRPPGPLGAPGGSGGTGNGGSNSRVLLILFVVALALAGLLAGGALLVPKVLDSVDGGGDDDAVVADTSPRPTATAFADSASATATLSLADQFATTVTEQEADPTDTATVAAAATAEPGATTASVPVGDAVPGPERSNPVPLGMVGSSSNGEWTLRLLEQYRGEEAAERLLEANPFNDPAPEGWQYLVALVEVTYYGPADAQGSNSTTRHVDFTCFSATGDQQVRWQWPGVVEPSPALSAELSAGQSAQGWIVLRARAEETNLLLFFEPFLSDVEGDEIFMALDADARVTPQTADLAAPDALGLTAEEAVPPGQRVTTITWEVWVLQVISGDAAERVLAEQLSASALDPPPTGMEYVLVEVGVRNISARWPSALIYPDMFIVRDGAGNDHAPPAVLGPDPELWYEAFTGGEASGWLTLVRPLDDPDARLVLLPLVDVSAEERYFLLDAAQARVE